MKRKCSICKKEARYLSADFKAFCGAKCGSVLALKLLEKRKLEEAKAARADYKKRKEALMSVSEWTKKVQRQSFNPYIRLRDKDDPCISCGRYDHEIAEPLTGGKWDAGHYRSRGACPELRFHPDNCHKQCKTCNGGSGKYARKNETVAWSYRGRLINKIGIDRVEWLESPHDLLRLRVDDLKEIYVKFKTLTKQLKNA